MCNIVKGSRIDTGKYIVTASNKLGSASAETSVVVLDVPDSPQNVRVLNLNENSLMLNWNTPANDGGSDILNYVVEQIMSDEENWKLVSKTVTSNELKYINIILAIEFT